MPDKLLELLATCNTKGGEERKEAVKHLWMIAKRIVPSRIHIDYGKDKGGAAKIRYGPNNYKIMDVDIEGRLYAYYESHWKKRLSKEDREKHIEELKEVEKITCSLDGSNQYLMVSGPIEEQDPEGLSSLLTLLIKHIERRFYPKELREV